MKRICMKPFVNIQNRNGKMYTNLALPVIHMILKVSIKKPLRGWLSFLKLHIRKFQILLQSRARTLLQLKSQLLVLELLFQQLSQHFIHLASTKEWNICDCDSNYDNILLLRSLFHGALKKITKHVKVPLSIPFKS